MGAWIRGKDIPSEYGISRPHAYRLLKQFREQADPQDVIKDERIVIVRKASFEDWWRNRK